MKAKELIKKLQALPPETEIKLDITCAQKGSFVSVKTDLTSIGSISDSRSGKFVYLKGEARG